MKVTFLSVGEATSTEHANNAHIVESSSCRILLDCGYSIPRELWKYNEEKDFLDAIYFSHIHADHMWGIVPILLRMWGDNRTKPLTLICQKKTGDHILQLFDLGYPGFRNNFKFPLNIIEVDESDMITFKDLTLTFAPTTHSAQNLAVKVSDGKHAMCYSGDGKFNEKTEALYEGSDLVIQETFLVDKDILGHASIHETIDLLKRKEIKNLALTHLHREVRKNEFMNIQSLVATTNKEFQDAGIDKKVLFPEPLDEYILT